MGSDMENPRSIVEKWVGFMNTHEASEISNLYHENAQNLQLAFGKPLVGREAILNDFRDFFQNIPNTTTKIENLVCEGDWACLEWSGTGTFQPTGKHFSLRGCGFFKVIDGKISIQRGYWDKATWFNQVGIPLT